MLKIKVEIKVPSQRDYKRMIWELREAVKFSMIEAVRKELLISDKPEQSQNAVTIEIGGKVLPENCHISPIVWVLRRDGWISELAAITITPGQYDGVAISI
jgi:hypothetical protein